MLKDNKEPANFSSIIIKQQDRILELEKQLNQQTENIEVLTDLLNKINVLSNKSFVNEKIKQSKPKSNVYNGPITVNITM